MEDFYAYGRVGLLGNPSDIYGGKCISFTFDKSAKVKIEKSRDLLIKGYDIVERDLDYNGTHKLVKATIKKLNLENRNFSLSYDSDIPVGSGLAGSSAIIIASIRAFNKFFGLELDKYEIAELALRVETEELNISAGFQDRYAISFEGVNYMDFFGKEYMRKNDKYGLIEKLDVSEIPYFLSLGVKPKSSAIVHNLLRERFLSGGLEAQTIKSYMDRIADLTIEGKNYLLRGDWDNLGKLMNKNTDLREEVSTHSNMDKKMINRAKELGSLGAKLAGSGGAVVILSDDKIVFDEMSRDYPCYRPKIIG